MGINVFYSTVVGDNDTEIVSKLVEIAESRSNLIIFSGGLGPTKDDLTKETIAKNLGNRSLYSMKFAMDSIEEFFR